MEDQYFTGKVVEPLVVGIGEVVFGPLRTTTIEIEKISMLVRIVGITRVWIV